MFGVSGTAEVRTSSWAAPTRLSRSSSARASILLPVFGCRGGHLASSPILGLAGGGGHGAAVFPRGVASRSRLACVLLDTRHACARALA